MLIILNFNNNNKMLMRQNKIILVSQNKSTLDDIENHLSYSLKKAACQVKFTLNSQN